MPIFVPRSPWVPGDMGRTGILVALGGLAWPWANSGCFVKPACFKVFGFRASKSLGSGGLSLATLLPPEPEDFEWFCEIPQISVALGGLAWPWANLGDFAKPSGNAAFRKRQRKFQVSPNLREIPHVPETTRADRGAGTPIFRFPKNAENDEIEIRHATDPHFRAFAGDLEKIREFRAHGGCPRKGKNGLRVASHELVP